MIKLHKVTYKRNVESLGFEMPCYAQSITKLSLKNIQSQNYKIFVLQIHNKYLYFCFGFQ